MIHTYSMRIMSAINLFNFLDCVKIMMSRLRNWLWRANFLMKILFTFQALLKRLKLKNNLPHLLINAHDSDRLLNNLLDSSMLDEDTELMINISMMHLSSHSLLELHHSIESTECTINTVSFLSSLSFSSSSVW